MKLIIGLGNPGQKYSKTRHNVGFAVLDCLAVRQEAVWNDFKGIAKIIKNDSYTLVKPSVFMNNSGEAIARFVGRGVLREDGVLVVHDDMDLDCGKIKIKTGGSAGGHNGIQSIIDVLGTSEFPRLRIGIGRPPGGVDPADFVLSVFRQEEAALIKNVVERAADAAEYFIEHGTAKTANIFNRKAEEDKKT